MNFKKSKIGFNRVIKFMDESSRLIKVKSSAMSTESHAETRQQCLNCGELLFGLYCNKCGQKDVSYSKPLGVILTAFFNSCLSVDNRTLRSVLPLFFRPGYLSAQFVAGKRMRFASPFKLYLFSSICYFFLFNISLRMEDKADVDSSFNKQIQKTKDQENTFTANSPANVVDTLSIQKSSWISKKTTPSKFAGRTSEKLKNPEKLRSSLLKGLSYMFFVLMPLFALLLKWNMGQKKQYFFDHLVLAVHFHAFALLFLSILLLAKITMGLAIAIYLLPVVVLYFIVSVKQFYDMNWTKSVVGSICILGFYGFFFVIALVSTSVLIIAW
jgi:hypothetical protein